MEGPMLQGERVYMREIQATDLDLVMEWRNRPEVMKCFFNRTRLTSEGQRKWFSRYQGDDTDVMFMILTQDNIRIGTMALYHIDRDNRKAEYGRALIADDRFTGKGLAREAMELLLAYAFDVLRLNRVYLEVFADNNPAVKLYEKCGFVREGLLRDSYNDGRAFRDVLAMGILKRDYDISKE